MFSVVCIGSVSDTEFCSFRRFDVNIPNIDGNGDLPIDDEETEQTPLKGDDQENKKKDSYEMFSSFLFSLFLSLSLSTVSLCAFITKPLPNQSRHRLRATTRRTRRKKRKKAFPMKHCVTQSLRRRTRTSEMRCAKSMIAFSVVAEPISLRNVAITSGTEITTDFGRTLCLYSLTTFSLSSSSQVTHSATAS